ncbi:MAG: hypothetical protein ABL866_03325 [Devosia sp.]
MKTTIKLAAIAATAAILLSSINVMPVVAGGLTIDKPVFVERPEKPTLKPDTRPGGNHDGEWHVEHDEPDPTPPGTGSDTPLAGPDQPQDAPKDEPKDEPSNEEGGESDVAKVGPSVSCTIWPDSEFLGATQDFVQIYNTGNSVMPAGTIIEIVMGDGTVYEFKMPADIAPGGNWALYSTMYDDFPADTGLSFGDCASDIVIA